MNKLVLFITTLLLANLIQAQNVGIGTNTPAAKLDIIGTIKITDGTQDSGKVLTSDANGLSSWKKTDLAQMAASYVPDFSCASIVGRLSTVSYSASVVVSGNYLYTADYDANTLSVLNVSNQASPSLVTSVPTGTNPSSIAIFGNILCVTDFNSADFKIYSIANPETPTLLSTTSIANTPRKIRIVGNYAYIISTSSGLTIYDISNPAAPTQIGASLNAGNVPWDFFIKDNYAYVINYYFPWNMMVYNISNPLSPVLVTTYSLGQQSGEIVVSGKYAYVTFGYIQELRVYDVSNPADPVYLTTIASGNTPNSMGITGNTLYLNNQQGFRLFSIATPGSITYTTYIPVLEGDQFGGTVANNYAYLSSYDNNAIHIIKLSCSKVLGFDISGKMKPVAIDEIAPAGTLTLNKVLKWNGQTLANSLITDNGTSIGIGTTTPARKLDVRGDIAQGNWLDDIPSRRIGVMDEGTQTAGMEIENTTLGGNYSQKLHLITHHYAGGYGRRLTINEDGYVGIGTENPTNLLSVAGNTDINGDLSVGSKITSPKFKVTQIWNQHAGLPDSVYITTGGGTVLLSVSGAGARPTVGTIGFNIWVDGVIKGSCKVFTNEANSHKAISSNFIVISGLSPGDHILSLKLISPTVADINDFFSASILELPF